jgi:hypothetical protein
MTTRAVHLHPSFRCVCGRVIRSWDLVFDDPSVWHSAFRIQCSGCDTELMMVERRQEVTEARS